MDLLLDRSGDEWVYKRDDTVRLPWERALHTVNDLPYLRPEVALLHKARHDRPKDRDDLAAAVLTPSARDWLAAILDRLGHSTWADHLTQDSSPTEFPRFMAAPGAPLLTVESVLAAADEP